MKTTREVLESPSLADSRAMAVPPAQPRLPNLGQLEAEQPPEHERSLVDLASIVSDIEPTVPDVTAEPELAPEPEPMPALSAQKTSQAEVSDLPAREPAYRAYERPQEGWD